MVFKTVQDANFARYKNIRPLLYNGCCPDCGSESLVCVDQVGHTIKDGDYNTPDSYDVDFYVYECQECGGRYKGD